MNPQGTNKRSRKTLRVCRGIRVGSGEDRVSSFWVYGRYFLRSGKYVPPTNPSSYSTVVRRTTDTGIPLVLQRSSFRRPQGQRNEEESFPRRCTSKVPVPEPPRKGETHNSLEIFLLGQKYGSWNTVKNSLPLAVP